MRPRTITRLEAYFSEFPTVLRGEPASDAAIEEAQLRLGCHFDSDYVEFLRLFGCGVVGPDPVYGIGPEPEAMGINSGVVHVTEWFRAQRWPGIDEWYIISGDGRGNPIGIAPDGQVRLSDHDVGDVPVLAPNFEAMLVDRLDRMDMDV